MLSMKKSITQGLRILKKSNKGVVLMFLLGNVNTSNQTKKTMKLLKTRIAHSWSVFTPCKHFDIK